MQKFIPHQKQSKRKQREAAAQHRRTWGGLSPVTRKPEHPKAYNRKKTRSWKGEDASVTGSFLIQSSRRENGFVFYRPRAERVKNFNILTIK